MKNKTFIPKAVYFFLSLLVVLPWLNLPAYANNEVYDGVYDVAAAIAYAKQHANDRDGLTYINKNGYAVEEDCTRFISLCLRAGGLPETEGWNNNSNHLREEELPDRNNPKIKRKVYRGIFDEGYKTFVNADRLNKYLAGLGYLVEKDVHLSGNTLSISVLHPAAGDILQYDWDGDGEIDHSVLYCGIVDGQPRYSAHSNAASMEPLSKLEKDIRTPTACDGRIYGTVTYLIHMTDTTGLNDVTSKYIKGGHKLTVALKSLEVNQYVSSDTDQNVTTVDAVANRNIALTWEQFEVVPNQYGAVGFKSCANGNYLSAIIDENAPSAPVRAAYGKNYDEPQTWESFRIYEKDGTLYLQNQANGKWLQVVANQDNHPLRAAAREASTWERFSIEIVS